MARPAPAPGDPVQGGRFDSLDGSYAYLYAGHTYKGAFAESFARDLNYTALGPRPLPRYRWEHKTVTVCFAKTNLQLVYIQAEGAQQLGQDDWLTRCDEDGYPRCREWATAGL